MTWARGGMLLQGIYQALWFGVWIVLLFMFDWAWTTHVFPSLHTTVLLMKMHSYAFYNGHLPEAEERLRSLDSPPTASKAPAYIYPLASKPGMVETLRYEKETDHAPDAKVLVETSVADNGTVE